MTAHKPVQSANTSRDQRPMSVTSVRYKYIHIWSSQEELRVQCTDQQTIQVLLRSIQRTYPDAITDTREDLTGQDFIVKIAGLLPDDRHQKIAWWLFKMLCERGWEPMQTGDHWYKMRTFERIE